MSLGAHLERRLLSDHGGGVRRPQAARVGWLHQFGGTPHAQPRHAGVCERGNPSLFFVQSACLPETLIGVRMNKSCLMMRCAQAQNPDEPIR
jgi:hypothetical protein